MEEAQIQDAYGKLMARRQYTMDTLIATSMKVAIYSYILFILQNLRIWLSTTVQIYGIQALNCSISTCSLAK